MMTPCEVILSKQHNLVIYRGNVEMNKWIKIGVVAVAAVARYLVE
jgi:hypothetical protein